MGQNWSLIVPEETSNLCTNPSFERATTGWSATGTNTIARSAVKQFAGVYSLLITYGNSTTLATLTISSGLATGTTYTITARLLVPTNWNGGDIRLNAANFTSATITQIREWDDLTGDREKWVELEIRLATSADATGTILLQTTSAASAGRTVYLDAVQIEQKAYPTTYCDGDQPGCAWNGVAHAATSTRDEFEASGGRLRNLDQDFDFLTGLDEGTGVFPLQMNVHPQPLLPGDHLQSINVLSRSNLLLRGGFDGETTPGLHAKRQALIKALNSRVGRIDRKPQPRQLYYHGAAVEKRIGVYYVAGLGVKDRVGTVGERVDGLQFYAPDPAWYDVGERAVVLDTGDAATARLIVGRIDDAWSVLGPPILGSGSYTSVRAIASDETYIYIGGVFSNWNDIANADNIVRYEKSTGIYSALGTGANNAVYALAIDMSGNLWAGGAFTTIGGVSTDNLGMWNGSAWSAPGTPVTGGSKIVYDIVVGKDGKIFVAGDFLNFDGIGDADYITYWNGSSWNALGTGGVVNGAIRKMAVAANGDVYMVGSFPSIFGVTGANRIAKWDGSNFSALGSGLNNTGYAITIDDAGNVYAGGSFTSPGTYIAKWNGSAWSGLGGNDAGSDIGDEVYCLLHKDGDLYASGAFLSAGGMSVDGRVARWNGSAWAHLDVSLPGLPISFVLYFDGGDLYIGFNTSGTATYSGQVTVSYSGSEISYPTLSVTRTGGTSARLRTVQSLTTRAELLFNYSLLDGETLTIDLRPGLLSVTSSLFGPVSSAVLSNSDMASFYLTPGNGAGSQNNIISALITEVGSPTVTAVLKWRDAHQSYD